MKALEAEKGLLHASLASIGRCNNKENEVIVLALSLVERELTHLALFRISRAQMQSPIFSIMKSVMTYIKNEQLFLYK